MNTNLHDTAHLDDRSFDRLVDGELSEEKRRELLVGLENEPGGWRRCALAFLEAQCWRQSVGQTLLVARGSQERLPHPTAADGTRSVPAAVKRSPWPGRLAAALAMAASFLLALGLGSLAQRARFAQPGLSDGGQVASATPGPQSAGPIAAPSQGMAPGSQRLVTVSYGQGPGTSFNLPAVERGNVDEQWLRSVPRAIPDDVLQALVRTGHQVQQRRELVPVPLQDGRRLLVPVDRVEVHYVGNRTY
jgi:hypothetical protein